MKQSFILLSFLFFFTISTNFGQLTVKDQEATPHTLMQVNDEGIAGSITLNQLTTIGTPASKLYNLGGVLHWSGSPVATGGSSLWILNGANIYRSSGNVGIGAINPLNKLHILGDFRIDDASPYLNFYSGTNLKGFIGFWTNNDLNIINSTVTGTISLVTKSLERMTIASDGKVGIGITLPEVSFHVDGNDGVVFGGTFGSGTVNQLGSSIRVMWYPKKGAFRSGYVRTTASDDSDIGDYSTALGDYTTASANYSTAMGHESSASGTAAFAVGYEAVSTSSSSMSLGMETEATNTASVATGMFTFATGYCSTSMGRMTKANSHSSMAVGSYNIGGGTANSWILTDPIFEIGNSNDKNNLSNAMTVLKNGNVGIGTYTPQGTLDVNGSIYQRGGVRHADYVFENDYNLESIEEHSEFMWKNKHLKAIPKATVDENGNEYLEFGAHTLGIVEELEKAHIYIEKLNDRNELLEKRILILESKLNELVTLQK